MNQPNRSHLAEENEAPPAGGLLCSPQHRPISTDKLNTLRCVHSPPINVVISNGSDNDSSSWDGLGA